jgi:hypothetical protein
VASPSGYPTWLAGEKRFVIKTSDPGRRQADLI